MASFKTDTVKTHIITLTSDEMHAITLGHDIKVRTHDNMFVKISNYIDGE